MPSRPSTPYFEVAPDWVCEVLSASTVRTDRVVKLPIYARQHVPYVWLVDPAAMTLEDFSWDSESYRLRAIHGGNELVRAVPFDAIELDLGALWGESAT